ncbi:MAG: hypothetical protein SFW09_19170 [Hyphomicrobiaceae bacterium]|nr:hypothetical protein [Hyphomicrobiaceae bacterium]
MVGVVDMGLSLVGWRSRASRLAIYDWIGTLQIDKKEGSDRIGPESRNFAAAEPDQPLDLPCAGVPDTKPDHFRRMAKKKAHALEIAVLRHDHVTMKLRVVPDQPVILRDTAEIKDMSCARKYVLQRACEARRQVCVE